MDNLTRPKGDKVSRRDFIKGCGGSSRLVKGEGQKIYGAGEYICKRT
jgi:hypothetical protein